MVMAFAALGVGPLKQMTQHRPPARISTLPNFVVVGLGAAFVCLPQVFITVLLHASSWFHGGTGGTYQVSSATSRRLHRTGSVVFVVVQMLSSSDCCADGLRVSCLMSEQS